MAQHIRLSTHQLINLPASQPEQIDGRPKDPGQNLGTEKVQPPKPKLPIYETTSHRTGKRFFEGVPSVWIKEKSSLVFLFWVGGGGDYG